MLSYIRNIAVHTGRQPLLDQLKFKTSLQSLTYRSTHKLCHRHVFTHSLGGLRYVYQNSLQLLHCMTWHGVTAWGDTYCTKSMSRSYYSTVDICAKNCCWLVITHGSADSTLDLLTADLSIS